MHLIPPDCSQEEAVVQLTHSLSAFQLTADQIFRKAALRADGCRQRMGQLGRRMEILERKMEAVEKLRDVPLLNCASNYPELGTPGLCEPVFARLDSSTPFFRRDIYSSEKKRFHPNIGATTPSTQWLKDAISRREDLSLTHLRKDWQRRDKMILDVERIEKLDEMAGNSNSDANYDQLLTGLMVGHRREDCPSTKPIKSPQIDFTESLLNLCPPTTNGRRPLAIGMDNDDPFAYESAEMGELADFDLPEDLPGIDVKSVSLLSKRSPESVLQPTEGSGDRWGDRRESSIGSLQAPTKDEEQTDEHSSAAADNVQPSETVDNPEVLKQSHGPPPPPPPPPQTFQQKKVGDVSSPPSGRSDLMAAIRAAGGVKGAKLKKMDVQENGKGGSAEAGKGSGTEKEEPEDLMSSLAKALERRRRGMFGKGGGGGTSGAEKRKQPRSGGNEPLEVLRERIPRMRVDSEEKEEEAEERNEWN